MIYALKTVFLHGLMSVTSHQDGFPLKDDKYVCYYDIIHIMKNQEVAKKDIGG